MKNFAKLCVHIYVMDTFGWRILCAKIVCLASANPKTQPYLAKTIV